MGIVLTFAVGVAAYGQPDIDIQGNGVSILNGDASPSTTDGTDFGDVEMGDSATHTFTIANTGDADLHLTGSPMVDISGTNAADFAVTQDPTTPIQSNSSTTFQIQFTPSDLGLRTAQVTITSDDPDENPYTFAIQGTGVDTIPPAKPASPDLAAASDSGHFDDDNVTNDNTPTFQGGPGAAEGNSTITVFSSIDGQLGTTVANADGSWSFTVSSLLTDGTHDITVTATDAAGNTSVTSDPLTVLIDTQAPNPPTITGIADDTGASSTDAITNDPTLFISGTAEAGSTVEVFRDGVSIGTTPTDGNEDWTFDYTGTSLSDGAYSFTATATDAAGNTSAESDAFDVLIDTQAPVDPTAALDAASDSGASDSDGLTKYTTVTFVGTAEPQSTVRMSLIDGSPVPGEGGYPTTTADANGDWSITCTVCSSNCNYTTSHYYKFTSTDTAGNSSEAYLKVDYDWEPPDVTGVTADPTPIVDATVGPGTFTLHITYDEEMNTAVAPIITFPVEDPANTIAFASGVWESTSVYVAAYDVVDANELITAIDVRVSGAEDPAGNTQDRTVPDVFDINTENPLISGLTVFDETVDDNCQATVNFSATVTDSDCVSADDVTVTVALTSGNAILGTPTINKTQVNQGEVGISGSVLVSNLGGCPATVQVTVEAVDCYGNGPVSASATGEVTDSTPPAVAWITPLPAGPVAVGPDACMTVIPTAFTVTDNCCLSSGNVLVDIEVTNATAVGQNIIVTQISDKQVGVALDVVVSDLTGCPAVLSVAIDATDCCGNAATQLTDLVEIYDHTLPVINDLVVDDHVLVSADCCVATVNFTANVTDNCCIDPDDVVVTVTLPTGNAVLENILVNKDQDPSDNNRVDITGSADVRCLTSCPAQVEVHIEATDCCGNGAVPVASTATEGRVYDETPPTAVDDPNGDEDRSASDDLEVRLDNDGQYRLMVREDTPIRIDVTANDTDNCSACTCCGTMWIVDIVDPPEYGTATIETDHGDCNGGSVIRYAPYRGHVGPDRFTYWIVDACGNVSATATVYLEIVSKTEMEDVYITTCASAPVRFEVSATDLLINTDNPSKIPFAFSVILSPMHGLLIGDLSDVSYNPSGKTTEEIESAAVELTYIPAAGFTGRDTMRIRFSDPFGGSSTATIDVLVSECNKIPERTIQLRAGEMLPILVPRGFEAIYAQSGAVGEVVSADGTAYPQALSAVLQVDGTYHLKLDTAGLPLGKYRVTIPISLDEDAVFALEEIAR